MDQGMLRFMGPVRFRCSVVSGCSAVGSALDLGSRGREFESHHSDFWPVGQAVKTLPFHGGNMGSIPVRVIYLECYEQILIYSLQYKKDKE